MQCYGCMFRGKIGFESGCKLTNRSTVMEAKNECHMTDDELDDILSKLSQEKSLRSFRRNIKKVGEGNVKSVGDRG